MYRNNRLVNLTRSGRTSVTFALNALRQTHFEAYAKFSRSFSGNKFYGRWFAFAGTLTKTAANHSHQLLLSFSTTLAEASNAGQRPASLTRENRTVYAAKKFQWKCSTQKFSSWNSLPALQRVFFSAKISLQENRFFYTSAALCYALHRKSELRLSLWPSCFVCTYG